MCISFTSVFTYSHCTSQTTCAYICLSAASRCSSAPASCDVLVYSKSSASSRAAFGAIVWLVFSLSLFIVVVWLSSQFNKQRVYEECLTYSALRSKFFATMQSSDCLFLSSSLIMRIVHSLVKSLSPTSIWLSGLLICISLIASRCIKQHRPRERQGVPSSRRQLCHSRAEASVAALQPIGVVELSVLLSHASTEGRECSEVVWNRTEIPMHSLGKGRRSRRSFGNIWLLQLRERDNWEH